jgi:hypothetical protein
MGIVGNTLRSLLTLLSIAVDKVETLACTKDKVVFKANEGVKSPI